MTDIYCTHSTFNPFGDGVRIGCIGAVGDSEISANLHGLCQHYSVDYATAKCLPYPDGSILMLQIERDSLATEIYLSEDAYPTFMRWAVEVHK